MKRDPICNMEVDEENSIKYEHESKTYFFCSQGCMEKFRQKSECESGCPSYDIVILGGGPAGLTAAVYAATLRLNTFLVASDLGGQAIDSTKIENYMGYDFITGPELVSKFKDQLIHSNYIDHLISEVEQIEASEEGFRITTSEHDHYMGKTLIVTTGMRRRKLNVPGEEEFQRKGILYGNVQDFSFIEGGDVAVIGGGNSALQMTENLGSIARSIHLVSEGDLTGDSQVIERVEKLEGLRKYTHHRVLQFKGKDSVSAIDIRKKGQEGVVTLPVTGVFIAIGLEPNSSMLSDLVDLNEKGEIIIKPDCSTSRPGLFAAGDVTDAFGKRIIIASGEGAKAALAARQYLLERERSGGNQKDL